MKPIRLSLIITILILFLIIGYLYVSESFTTTPAQRAQELQNAVGKNQKTGADIVQ